MINTYKTRIRISKIATKRSGIVKYTALSICGFLLFKLGQAAALNQRGYIAHGGEYLLLALPLYYHTFKKTIDEIKKELQEIMNE